jgi:hypothetical protein
LTAGDTGHLFRWSHLASANSFLWRVLWGLGMKSRNSKA